MLEGVRTGDKMTAAKSKRSRLGPTLRCWKEILHCESKWTYVRSTAAIRIAYHWFCLRLRLRLSL
jgi:hypothetical protein